MRLPNDNSWNTDNVMLIGLLILYILCVGEPDILDGIIAFVNP